MGAVLKRWRREETAEEVLESLEKQLQRLESTQQRDEQRHKRFIGLFMFYSILLYIITAVLFYLYYFPKLWKDRIIKSIPLIIFPGVIYGIRKVLHYFFNTRSKKNAIKLEELRAKKHKVIEDVKEKETYKKAKEILEKFDPDSSLLKKDVKPETSNDKPVMSTPGTDVRQRKINTKNVSTPITPFSGTPLVQSSPLRGMSPAMQRQFFINNIPPGTPPGPPKPMPVRAKERTLADKFVDYLVGDGPNNRYALLCKACHSHNGMSLKEDFEYTTFRCCYCYHLNEAPQQRPSPPPLEGFSSSDVSKDESASPTAPKCSDHIAESATFTELSGAREGLDVPNMKNTDNQDKETENNCEINKMNELEE